MGSTGSGLGRQNRVSGTVLAVALVVAGCAGAVSTPSPSAAPTTPTAVATPTAAPSVRASLVTATPTPIPATPTPTPPGAAVPAWLQGDFDVAMGSVQPLASASDSGSAAANELDQFGLDLIRKLESSDKNLCMSPASIALALAMVEPGAKGQTAAEMAQVMHGFGSDADASEVLALLNQLRSDTEYTAADGSPLMAGDTPDPANPNPPVELNLANEVFLQKGTNFQQAYLDRLTTAFGAGSGLLDFRADPESARLAINKWAGDQTHGRIPNILSPNDITPATRIALVNATYLKAAWANKFDPSKTRKVAFTTASGAKHSVPTMAADELAAYSAGKDYQAVTLGYSGNFEMTVVMPTDMTAFLKTLDGTKLAGVMSSRKTYQVDLTLPRFSIDTRTDLAGTLSGMGMPTVFGPGADLSGITTDEPLLLSGVIHEANIDVVEEGTTAAAVTVVVGATMGGGGPDQFPAARMHVDHPFLYFINETTTGVTLFSGVVNDPAAK